MNITKGDTVLHKPTGRNALVIDTDLPALKISFRNGVKVNVSDATEIVLKYKRKTSNRTRERKPNSIIIN